MKVRVLVENEPDRNPVYEVTPAHVRAAARRVPGVAGRLQLTYNDDPGAFHRLLKDAEVLLIGRNPGPGLAEAAPRLRWIQSMSAGVEKYLPHVPPGVRLTNASGVHGPKGGEYGMTAILMLNHRVPEYVQFQRERRWEQRWATTVAGKTVVVVGLGEIGAEVARLARRWGLRVLGVRRTARPHPAAHETYGPRDLARILPRADFLVAAAPATPDTRGLVGRRELDRLPPHAGVVNLGRAAVVDEAALCDKLRRGELRGAVLEVFDREPLPPDSPVWDVPNLVVSAHCGVDDAETYVPRCLDIFLDNARRYLARRPLRNLVDPALGY
jgi:phosphoglycerate dehydrogenase-like enzyme